MLSTFWKFYFTKIWLKQLYSYLLDNFDKSKIFKRQKCLILILIEVFIFSQTWNIFRLKNRIGKLDWNITSRFSFAFWWSNYLNKIQNLFFNFLISSRSFNFLIFKLKMEAWKNRFYYSMFKITHFGMG